jgi:hypothetical protein
MQMPATEAEGPPTHRSLHDSLRCPAPSSQGRVRVRCMNNCTSRQTCTRTRMDGDSVEDRAACSLATAWSGLHFVPALQPVPDRGRQ